MKKFLFVIIVGALLISGCKDSEIGGKSSTMLPSKEIGTQISGQSAPEISGSEPLPESSEAQNPAESRAAAMSEPVVSVSEDTSSSYAESAQEVEVSLSNSERESDISFNASEKAPETSSTERAKEPEAPESESNTSSNISEKAPETSETSSIVSENDREIEQPTCTEENTLKIEITVNGRIFSATLYDNETAGAFKEQLPLALDMSELNGNEKYYYLQRDLPANSSRPSGIHSGDIMLYGNSCLVLFYEDFLTSYSYTPIGRIDDPNGLAAALGNGNVQVFFN